MTYQEECKLQAEKISVESGIIKIYVSMNATQTENFKNVYYTIYTKEMMIVLNGLPICSIYEKQLRKKFYNNNNKFQTAIKRIMKMELK